MLIIASFLVKKKYSAVCSFEAIYLINPTQRNMTGLEITSVCIPTAWIAMAIGPLLMTGGAPHRICLMTKT